MAHRTARTTVIVTLNEEDVKRYAQVPVRASKITAVEAIKYGDNPIRSVRITFETETRHKWHRTSAGRWRR
jgi:hypothetical protein